MADEFFQLLQIGQPSVAVVLPGDSPEQVGQPGLLRVAHSSLCKDTSSNISTNSREELDERATRLLCWFFHDS